MKKPIEVPTQTTVEFIASQLSPGTAILEIGCGEGHVALELLNRGYDVTGVDSNQDVIKRARERGVPTLHASWPEFEGAPVDAIVFTRSLHHISPLQQAVGKAQEVLRTSGMLLVEDFAFDEVDNRTITWFLEALGSQAGKAVIAPVPGELVTDLLGSEDPEAVWHQSHDHALHTAKGMTQAIEDYFIIREIQSVPYLYRYLVPVLPETAEAAVFVEEVFREETRHEERGEGVLIGRRIVGLPRQGE